MVLAGRYSIVEAIGAGGMGTVYRGMQLELSREVAIKLIGNGREATAEQIARFEREARLLARLSHPAIVTVHDFGRAEDGTWFLVLELVRGESLAQRLTRGPLPWTEAVAVGIQIAEALAAAHHAEVLHRDLKPSNIMLSSAAVTRVKLIDFGLARLAHFAGEMPATASSYVMGTPGYIAPEYAWTGAVSPQMDLYALGLVLFEMLTGSHPFAKLDHTADRLAEARANLKEHVGSAPPELHELVLALLSPEPARRPRDPADRLVELLDAHRRRPPPDDSARFMETSASVFAHTPGTPAVQRDAPRMSTPPPPALVVRPTVHVDGALVRLLVETRIVEVRVAPFEMDKHPVTNAEWAMFIRAHGLEPPTTWEGPKPPRGEQSCPVTGVSFESAAAFARWSGRRLPSEAEWVLAASGPEQRPWPWGDAWESGLCHTTWEEPFEARRPGPIGMFSPGGDSAAGVSDLLQIWEWVSAPYQHRGAVVRGGPWRDRCLPPRLDNRSWENAPAPDVGFRCAR